MMNSQNNLVLPKLGSLYARLGDPTFAFLRVIAGVALMTHGYGKILDPFGAVGMVESLGFFPGELWSPALAVTEFFGGLLLALGVLTRPAAVAATVVLAVTVYFHWVAAGQGYTGAEKSILWAAITLFFAVHGGGRLSLDRLLRREI